MSTYGLIVAGGKSERFGGDVPKQFRTVCGKPLLSWTISRFEAAASIDRIVVVVAEEYLLYASEKVVDPYGFPKVSKIVIGGETRSESVARGLQSIPISTKFVAIHDGARPLVLPEDIDRTVDAARRERAAMLATPATDTIKRVKDGYILATIDRRPLYLAQTPQVFQYDLINESYQDIASHPDVTDDASLVEDRGFKVCVVEPTGPNIKVTTAEDLLIAEAFLKQEVNNADG